MKQVIITVVLLALGLCTFAQNAKYIQRMKANIALLDSAQTPDDYVAVAAAFERIGDVEKNQWLPYYYSSLAHVWRAFRDTKSDKDQIAAQATSLINKAEALDNNAEVAIVKNMIATVQMMVDPASRYMSFGTEAGKALEQAKKLDPNNPRIYFLEGQSVMYTPPQFGGGKDKAKPLFEKAIALFEAHKLSSELHPSWGKPAAERSLAQCQ